MLDFTSDELFGESRVRPNRSEVTDGLSVSDLTPEDVERITTDFISSTCEALAPRIGDKIPVVIDLGELLLFMIFKRTDSGSPSGEIQEAYLAMSLFGQEWIMVPSEYADWIVDKLTGFIAENMNLFEMIDKAQVGYQED